MSSNEQYDLDTKILKKCENFKTADSFKNYSDYKVEQAKYDKSVYTELLKNRKNFETEDSFKNYVDYKVEQARYDRRVESRIVQYDPSKIQKTNADIW